MTNTEVAALLAKFSGTYRQEITDDVAMVWAELLAKTNVAHAHEVADLYIRTEKFFPAPSEFLSSVKELERADELKHIASNRTHAAFRCDGSGWRCAACQRTECSLDCESDKGVEPCPTCNPHLYDKLSNPAENEAWRNGKKSEDGLLPRVPDCPRLPGRGEDRESATNRMHEAEMSDWNQRRKDLI